MALRLDNGLTLGMDNTLNLGSDTKRLDNAASNWAGEIEMQRLGLHWGKSRYRQYPLWIQYVQELEHWEPTWRDGEAAR